MSLLDPPTDPSLDQPRPRHRLAERPRRFRFSPVLWVPIATLVCALVVGLVLVLRSDPEPPRTTAGAPVVPKTSASAAPSASAPSASAAPDLPEGAFTGDGHYTVGVEIAPGRYTAAGPSTPGVPGTWARCRLSDPPCGTVSDVIDNGRSTGQPTVTLRGGQIFETRGFSEWRKVA